MSGCSMRQVAARCVNRTGSGRSAGWPLKRQPVSRPCAVTICVTRQRRYGWVSARKVVQRVMGHATAAMTMDLYGHMVDANLWQAARLVGGATGASEPTETGVRTESEPGPGTKNP